MSQTDAMGIKLGLGGKILNDPANQELLDKILAAPALSPTSLLKLATFYQTYSTNESLSNHLALLALKDIVSNPNQKLQDALARHDRSTAKFAALVALAGSSSKAQSEGTYSSIAAVATDDPWWDVAEDFFNGAIDAEDNAETHSGPLPQTDVRWVLFSNVGLLIETHLMIGTNPINRDRFSYVIGVSPSPADLPG